MQLSQMVTHFIVRNEGKTLEKITHLHCNLEGHLSDGAERRIESSFSQVLLCYHVSYRLREKNRQKYCEVDLTLKESAIHTEKERENSTEACLTIV